MNSKGIVSALAQRRTQIAIAVLYISIAIGIGVRIGFSPSGAVIFVGVMSVSLVVAVIAGHDVIDRREPTLQGISMGLVGLYTLGLVLRPLSLCVCMLIAWRVGCAVLLPSNPQRVIFFATGLEATGIVLAIAHCIVTNAARDLQKT